MEVVEPGVPVELGEDEGILILHVDTDVAIKRVALESGTVATQLPEGDHLWMIRTRARRSGWKRLDFAKLGSRHPFFNVAAMDVLNDDEFDFQITPGVINYPGTLVVRTQNTFPAWPPYFISVRNRNHSAMAVRALLKSHQALLDSLPIRYGGSRGDTFLDFYTKERDRLKSEPASEAN